LATMLISVHFISTSLTIGALYNVLNASRCLGRLDCVALMPELDSGVVD